MARLKGLEPLTRSLEGCRSIQLSYRRSDNFKRFRELAPANRPIVPHLLSLVAADPRAVEVRGRGDGIRTCDRERPRLVLYQAELLPGPPGDDSSIMARRMPDLLLASQNPGKLNEMRLLVEGLPFRVLGPRDLGIHEAPDETGETFLENATIKALHYARLSGLLTVADDSGLSVDALGGAPGLYSSRFGGEGASDLDRNLLLLEKLRDVPRERRGARFTSAVAAAREGEVLFEAQESVEGTIADEMRGAERLRLRPALLLPAVRPHVRRGRAAGEGPREPPRQGLRPAAGVPGRARRASALSRLLRARSRRGPSSGAATRSWMPLSAAASSSCISSSQKGCPSAVPCSSTKRPRPVLTTFMSTWAEESSS